MSAPQPPRCLQRSGPSVLQLAGRPALRPASTPALQPPVLQLPSTPALHRSRVVGAVIAITSVPNGVRAQRARPCLPPRGSHSRAGKANDLGSLPPARCHVSARVLAPAPFQRARFCHRAAHPPPAGFIFGHRCSPRVRAFTLRPCVSAPVPARTQHRPRADPRQPRDRPALNFSTITHAVCSWHRSPSPSRVANCQRQQAAYCISSSGLASTTTGSRYRPQAATASAVLFASVYGSLPLVAFHHSPPHFLSLNYFKLILPAGNKSRLHHLIINLFF